MSRFQRASSCACAGAADIMLTERIAAGSSARAAARLRRRAPRMAWFIALDPRSLPIRYAGAGIRNPTVSEKPIRAASRRERVPGAGRIDYALGYGFQKSGCTVRSLGTRLPLCNGVVVRGPEYVHPAAARGTIAATAAEQSGAGAATCADEPAVTAARSAAGLPHADAGAAGRGATRAGDPGGAATGASPGPLGSGDVDAGTVHVA